MLVQVLNINNSPSAIIIDDKYKKISNTFILFFNSNSAGWRLMMAMPSMQSRVLDELTSLVPETEALCSLLQLQLRMG
jgi:hypothetical protein